MPKTLIHTSKKKKKKIKCILKYNKNVIIKIYAHTHPQLQKCTQFMGGGGIYKMLKPV